MNDKGAIETATRRLAAALDGLEAALDRRREVDGRESSLSVQLAALGADRSRLASELDQQTARSTRLDAASREVSQRLDSAMDRVRSMVEAQER